MFPALKRWREIVWKTPEEQLQSMSLMRRFVRLQEYATLLHVLSESVEDVPEWMRSLSEKLKLRGLEEAMDKGVTD